MSEIDWEREWNDVQSEGVLSKCRDEKQGLCDYFDGMAEEYLQDVIVDEPLYRGIVDFLERERFIREGDEVLDISCGPGTYTFHFARLAKSVSALDPSEGMISVLMREAARRGLSNVRPIRSRWEDHDGDDRYDMVFTALSPGVTGPETFLKMERYSRRSCGYIGFGEGSNNDLSDELWALVMSSPRKKRGFDITYPFNLLCSKGRKPNVRFFEKKELVREPCEGVIESNVKWLGLFARMNASKKKQVREYIMARSSDGHYEHVAKQSLAMLYWDVPGR